MTLLTEHDVVNMVFKEPASANSGYDQDEVDVFLDEVAETIRKLTKDKADLENKVKAAEARVTELEKGAAAPVAPGAGSTASEATGVLQLAQQLHDQHVSEGQAEAKRLVSEAETKSQNIVAQAENKYNETLAKLETEKGLLERKISELRDFERDYRTRLKSYLESLLTSVESDGKPKND